MQAQRLMLAMGCFVIATALGPTQMAAQAQSASAGDPIKALVGRLDLERYKATIKGLTQFGDRTQGTDRNRAAVDWIAAQSAQLWLHQSERIQYVYDATAARPPTGARAPQRRGTVIASGEFRTGRGRLTIARHDDAGDRRTPIPRRRSDPTLRALNAQQRSPGPREEVYCTKVGTTHPEEMYIVGAHMDGRGFGEAADDDGSGAALVMELARVFSGPGC